jgi:CDP-4-dehydro-6-deoxyglucose reductase
MQLRLQLPANEKFRYHAGQYIEFILRDGARRAYSMANAPHTQEATPGIELHIRHMPGGKFTDHVFGAMKEKEILRVEGPFGSFFLREDSDKPIILLASGTGFAPIKALIEHMQHQGITRPAALYWGGRRPPTCTWTAGCASAWPPAPAALRARGLRRPARRRLDGRTGFVHQAVLDDFADLSGHQVYACGAPIVVDSARAAYTSSAACRPKSSTPTPSPPKPTSTAAEIAQPRTPQAASGQPISLFFSHAHP